MRKIYSLLCMLMLGIGMYAQKGNLILSTPELNVEYQVVSISPNGKWACGNIYEGSYRGFLWNLTSGEVTELSVAGSTSLAMCINDAGTIAGIFTSTDNTPNNTPIEVPGYYQNGKWHVLSMETEEGYAVKDALVQAVSNDGTTFGGIGSINGRYLPLVWIDGKVRIVDDNVGSIFTVSSDGKIVAGWTNHPEKKNRTACIWKTKDQLYDEKILVDESLIGPFNYVRKISPNGKYAIAFNCRYNIEDNTSVVYEEPFDALNFSLNDVDNEGCVYGSLDNADGHATIKYDADGNKVNLRDYLLSKGLKLGKYPTFYDAYCASADGKTIGLLAMDAKDIPRSLVFRLDVDTMKMAPVALKSQLLDGVNTVRLTWKAPLANVKAVKGYNIYRNGTKINTEPVTDLLYMDKALAVGDYVYAISALYGTEESEMSEAASVTVKEFQLMKPRNLKAIHSSLNDVRLVWSAPYSNKPALGYYSPGEEFSSFGGDNVSFECAIRMHKEILANYKSDGYQITDVAFVPQSRQKSWTVAFYEEGSMVPFYTEVLPSEDLVYGEENRFHLAKPVTIPDGKDVVMGIQVDATGFGGYEVMGMVVSNAQPGYSDLLRQASETDFYSLYDASMTASQGAMAYRISWAISMLMGKADAAEGEVKEYKVYSNGEELGATTSNKYRQENLADGDYKFEVAAVYASGKASEKDACDFTMKQNTDIYRTITPKVAITKNVVKATWETPLDNDESYISFASNRSTGGLNGTESNQYSYMVATKYSGNKLVDYDGFRISGFRFYPLSDAEFAFILKAGENGKELARIELTRGVDYVLNRWNTIKLPEPITLDRFMEYFLILDCYDVTPNTAPVGLDDQPAYATVSDLYSMDDGNSFLSLSMMGGKNANWMIGLAVETENPKSLPIEQYNIYVDNKIEGTVGADANEFSTGALSDGPHQLRVNPVYGNGVGEKRSGAVTFIIDLASGIDEVTDVPVRIVRNASSIKVQGENVSGIAAYNMAGAKVAQTAGNVLDISSLAEGVYVLDITAGGKEVKIKVCINR